MKVTIELHVEVGKDISLELLRSRIVEQVEAIPKSGILKIHSCSYRTSYPSPVKPNEWYSPSKDCRMKLG